MVRAGDTAQGLAQGTQRWAFRGRRVVAALANHLAARQGLGNAMHVLVTGDSAGGVSALNNADFMLQRVKGSLHRCTERDPGPGWLHHCCGAQHT